MKLTDITVNYERQAQIIKPTDKSQVPNGAQPEATEAQRATKHDVVVNISSESKDLNVAREAVNKLPETRVEKVEAIQKAITEESYQVDPDKLAEKIINFKPNDIF